jgi:hypothetical protein
MKVTSYLVFWHGIYLDVIKHSDNWCEATNNWLIQLELAASKGYNPLSASPMPAILSIHGD